MSQDEARAPDPLPRLTGEEQRLLLDLARRSIAARLERSPLPQLVEPPPRLLAEQGAFVSLHSGRALRGCVGMVMPAGTLAETVATCAAAAATEDPRFPPLRALELPGLRVEISVLDTPFPVDDLSRIIVGSHGLIVSDGRKRGLLLPQVAVEQGWDVPTFLEETCLKAGLAPDAAARGAAVEAFSAQVFSEEDR